TQIVGRAGRHVQRDPCRTSNRARETTPSVPLRMTATTKSRGSFTLPAPPSAVLPKDGNATPSQTTPPALQTTAGPVSGPDAPTTRRTGTSRATATCAPASTAPCAGSLGYPDIATAADAVPRILTHDPVVLEGVDH